MLSTSPAGTLGGPKLNKDQETNNSNIISMPSGMAVSQVDNPARDSEFNTASSIAPSINIDSIPSSSISATSSEKRGSSDTSSTLNVNSILTDADNAALAAQTIAPLAPGTTTTNSNMAAAAVAASNTATDSMKPGQPAVNMNFNQYVLTSAGIPALSSSGASPINNNATIPVTSPAVTDPNNSNAVTQHIHSAILQQNAAIMQQNAATLQNLQNLHQTNKLLAPNPETLGMLAPIMNMANPAQLLAPPLNLNPTMAGTFLPTALHGVNLTDVTGAPALAAPAPNGTQPQQTIPIPGQLGTIAVAPGASQAFPMVANNGIINGNNGLMDVNNEAVQNFLRTAIMLQNGGLPFLQQGMIPQQQQQQQQALLSAAVITPSGGNGSVMVVPNGNASPSPFGVVPASLPAIDDSKKNGEVANGSGAAAAANAAASVLPPASMNLPLQQQLQQHQSQLNSAPQMGINVNNNNNAIALLGGTALNPTQNNLQIAGLAQLQQQQQQNQAIVFPPVNLSEAQLQIPLMALQPQQKQQPLAVSNPVAATQQLNTQQQSSTQKKPKSISLPIYLDHDSNCLTAYQCFLRKQIELFEVGHDEMTGTAQGRNTPLQYGQVGIRCRHCAHLPKSARARGGVYYSRTIDGVYQVAQNMSKLHFLKACTLIPENTKNQLKSLQSVSSRASGGKEYWAEGLRVLGIVEEGGILRFANNNTNSVSNTTTSKSSE